MNNNEDIRNLLGDDNKKRLTSQKRDASLKDITVVKIGGSTLGEHDTSLQDVVDKLKAGTPPIWTRVKDGEDHIEIHIFGLKPGEEDLVGKRIADIFK